MLKVLEVLKVLRGAGARGAEGAGGAVPLASLAAAMLVLSGGEASPAAHLSDPLFCGRVIAVTCTGRSSGASLVLEARPGDALEVQIAAPLRRDVHAMLGDDFRQRNVCIARSAAPGLVPYAHPTVSDASQISIKDDLVPGLTRPVFTTCDPAVRAPSPVHQVRPVYPTGALRARATGTVGLTAVVDATGQVGDIHVARPVDEKLDAEAIKAFAQWRFRPAQREGKPVPVSVTADFAFTLAHRE